MIDVQTFNSNGDIIANDSCDRESAVRRLARYAFAKLGGVSINGHDCFTFHEVDRAIKQATAEVVA